MTSKDLIDPSVTWIAKHATLSNFKNAIKTLEMPGSLFNSIWFSALLALAQTAYHLQQVLHYQDTHLRDVISGT